MKEVITMRILKAFALTYDFYADLSEKELELRIIEAPSNTMGEQGWCILGARESYLKALVKGEWDGFSCSLKDTKDKEEMLKKLEETNRQAVLLFEETAPLEPKLLLDLLEHEVQHHGQLIRYAYANGLRFPPSWKARYTV